jgi:uncharacterized protein
MSKQKTQKTKIPDKVQVPRATVQRYGKIAKYLRILLYLGCAYLLFSKAKAADDFQVRKIKVGAQILSVEIADDNYKRSLGLMNRKVLEDGRGMLFIFDQEQPLSFWMKNTLIPLTIGYFDQNKKLFQTVDMTPASPMEIKPPSYPSSRPGKYALEVPVGWYSRHKIKTGTTFTFVDEVKASKPGR